ncbi:MAG TPA: hypothetical protein PK867_24975, partial [Pirellulales bacterium]|nr:hypothetical protein [Pirellulales bacterium]
MKNEHLTQRLKTWLIDSLDVGPDSTNEEFSAATVKALQDGDLTEDTLDGLITKSGGGGVTSRELFGGSKSAGRGGSVNVKNPSERYSDFTYRAKHAKTGKPVRDQKGAEVQTASERTIARIGAFLKWRASREGLNNVQLNEHEQAMVREMFDEKEVWAGDFGGTYRDDWSGTQVKALLSDTTSGGVYVNPLWYDQAIITYPLL